MKIYFIIISIILLAITGCTKVGPDFKKQEDVNLDNLFSDIWTKSISKKKKEPKKNNKINKNNIFIMRFKKYKN